MPALENKAQDEKQVVIPESKKDAVANCFGVIVCRHTYAPSPRPDNQFILTIGVKPNKTDPSNTHGEVIRKESIPDMVHAAAKDVGLQAVIKAINMGLRSFESIVDDGNGSVDDTLIPEYVGDIGKEAARAKETSDEILTALGVDPSTVKESNLNNVIQDIVNQAVAKLKSMNESAGGTPDAK